MACGVNGHDCRGCENWCGGCLYDMELEAKESGRKLDDLVNSKQCLYYESVEQASWERSHDGDYDGD